MRQEQFVAPATFDRFEHDDSGSWVEWDRRALDKLAQAANEAGEKPLFAFSFLMSSHFEYQYPPEFARYAPADAEVRFGVTRLTSLGPEAAIPLMNRYKNCMAFLDATVADAIDRLDPQKNIVVVTGDHGESIHDDGRYGHGHAFSDVVARTPMFIVGPGIPARTEKGPTLHADLLPTLARALAPNGRDLALGGRDLSTPAPPRESVLLAHTSWDGSIADVLLVSGDDRVRLELELRQPAIHLKGFEDARGQPLPLVRPSSEQIERLRRAFASELFALGGGRP